jgi:16S rRNA (guanine527-N7)-methyltransferase
MQELELGAVRLGLSLDPQTVERCERLLRLLEESNSRFNLTALHDAESVVRRHFVESVELGRRLDEHGLLTPDAALLDLGSGPGFPGLPLKLVWPGLRLTLVEATAKKAQFIAAAVRELELGQTRVLTGRAETLAHDAGLRESHDVVVARSVAALPALVEMALPFLRVGGTLAAVKGSRWQEELTSAAAALRLCGGAFAMREMLGEGGQLSVLFIQKTGPTPARYPRRPGRPATHPLQERR